MGSYLFKQLRFVRNQTLLHAKEITNEMSHYIPAGFNNNIKWNLGHIYTAQEKLAFQIEEEQRHLPPEFIGLFGPGSKPDNWNEEVPHLSDLVQLLINQVDRVERSLEHRLTESVEEPYVTSTGIELLTVEEFLSFCLYHEGMHFDAIKSILRVI